jgi:hypothetical protein
MHEPISNIQDEYKSVSTMLYIDSIAARVESWRGYEQSLPSTTVSIGAIRICTPGIRSAPAYRAMQGFTSNS